MSNQSQPFGSGEQAASPSDTETPAAGPPPPAEPPEAAGQGEQDAPRTNRASHSYGGEGQGGGEEREGQKTDQIKILRLGVDGLVLSYEGEISPDLDYDLMERKNLAQSPYKDEQARAQWAVKGHIFEVSHRGQKPFAYILEDKAFRICLASSGSKSVPLAYVKISSELLAHKGPEAAADELAGIVSEFGEAGVYPMPSRVDLCVDFQTDVDIEGFTRHAWVTRAGAIDSYSRQGNFTGWTIGKGGPISARLYNKSLEITQKSGKTFFIDLWKRAGMDPDRPVWRLEFQFMREVLNELGIRSFEGLMRDLGGLWGYATQTWLRLAVEQKADSNRARWATHPMWEQLAAILWRLDDVPLVRKFSPARVPAADKLYRLYMSILTSFIASDTERKGIDEEDKAKGYADGVGIFHRRAEAFHVARCEDKLGIRFEDWIELEIAIKRRKFNTLINVPSLAKDSATPEEVDRDAIDYSKASRGE